MNAHQVTREFEKELCTYTGAPFAVAVNSCTAALMLACLWNAGPLSRPWFMVKDHPSSIYHQWNGEVSMPKRTYVGVPMAVVHAGCKPTFRDEEWQGEYRLEPFPVWDAARRFTSGMYHGGFQCVSFHWSKILGLSQGGAILHNDPVADRWLRRARFDGRTEGVPPAEDTFDMLGYHCYLSPSVAADGLMRLSTLPLHNKDLPNSNYSDLSLAPIFK